MVDAGSNLSTVGEDPVRVLGATDQLDAADESWLQSLVLITNKTFMLTTILPAVTQALRLTSMCHDF